MAKETEVDIGTLAKWGAIAVLAILAITMLFGVVQTINVGEVGAVLVFGKYDRTMHQGINFVVPFITQVYKIPVQIMKYSTYASAASNDLQTVHTNITVNYKVRENNAAIEKLFTEFRTDYEDRIIAPLVQEVVKASTAQFNAAELINRRPEVASMIHENLRQRLTPYGIDVVEISITNFEFSAEYTSAIESKVIVEQQKQRTQLELDQKIIEVQKMVAEANATRQSAILRAEGEATAKLTVAEAQAKAIQLVNSQITPSYVSYVYATQWNGALPMINGQGVLPLVNLPMNTQVPVQSSSGDALNISMG